MLALVITIAGLISAVWFVRQDRTGLMISVCSEPAIRVALVAASLLVILFWLIGNPITLVV